MAIQRDGGRLRIYLVEGGTRTLIRSSPIEPSRDDGAILAREATSLKSWQRAKAKVTTGALRTALEEQGDWLETAHQLEQVLAKDPEHLGVLRDLVVAYGRLLAFEGPSAFGGDLFRATGQRLDDLERKAAPLDAADRAAAAQIRSWLFTIMELPPMALHAIRDYPNDASQLRATLEPLGQGRYEERTLGSVGPMNLRLFRTLGTPADPSLLWSDTYVVASAASGRADRTIAYVLARRADRYYLLFRSANRTKIVALYGTRRPADRDLQATVEQMLHRALKR